MHYDPDRKLYRARNGRIFGVCKGFAKYFDVPLGLVRMGAVLALFFTGFTPVIVVYLVLAFVLKLEPVIPIETAEDEEFYNSYTGSREMAILRIKRVYDGLDRRIQRMEAIVTARDYDWDRRLNEGR